MLKPQQILSLCERRYPRFLRSLVTGEQFFPLDVPFGRLKATHDHQQISDEVKALAEANLDYRIEWSIRRFRLTGEQRIPSRIWFENAADYLKAIRKSHEVDVFLRNLELTRCESPLLVDWVAKHPTKMASQSEAWPGLLKVCEYFRRNPQPGVYARELPIQVSTKFVEEHKEILHSLLQHVFPDLPKRNNGESFEDRYGLRSDESSVRFRALDTVLLTSLGLVASDITVPVSEVRNFEWSGISVIIAENKMTFLTMPALPNAISIWGGGCAAQILASLTWLKHCRVVYWGDVDTHGFHIVSRLRGALPHLETVMMDILTLDDCNSLIVPARDALYEDTIMLSAAEHAAYVRVKSARLLLEQEKIPQQYAVTRLRAVLADFSG